ncbi:MAG: 2-phosphosulfolactate phosphatase [Steroidobacteraceae bacterium]|nr:2-phosphosulfolactate phosphatase [Steroidobacteraceae bacterium]
MAIVIDVFRACSVVAHALAAGAARVIPVEDVEAARELKRANPDWLLVGERHARRLPGFDCGNSPTEVLAVPGLAGRTLVHTTHAGTQGLAAAARSADAVLTGAFVNAAATVRRVRALGAREVTIVAMGHEARERCVEDSLCGELLRARLLGEAFDESRIVPALRAAPAAVKFFDPAADWAPEGDFALCSALDVHDFAVQLRPQPEGFPALERVA